MSEAQKSTQFQRILPANFEIEGFKLFLAGKTLQEIATVYGVTEGAIRRVANKEKWAMKGRFTGKVSDLTPESVEHLWRKKNDDVKLAIRDLVSQGKRLKTCAELFGWTVKDLHEWIKEDPEFQRRLDQAVAIFECKMTDEVRAYQGKDWKAKPWLLGVHEGLKEVYKEDDEQKGMQITVNLDRPVLSVVPNLPILEQGEVIDAEIVPLIEGPQVEQIKPLTTKLPQRSIIDVAAERMAEHNQAILKRRKQRQEFWKKKESKSEPPKQGK